jgi:phenylacetate-CoA ligase
MIRRFFNAYILYPLAEHRLKRDIRSKLSALKDFENLPSAERRQSRTQRLVEMLKVAGSDVPYYRELFQNIGFAPEKVLENTAYLETLPYLTKDIVRKEGDRLLNERLPKASLHVRKTGGSTGPSTLIYYCQEALDWTAAVSLFCRFEWAGKKAHDKEAHLSSKFPDVLPARERIKERIKCEALNRINIYTDRFDDEALERVWRDLERARPYLFHGHPSTMYALAQFVMRQGYNAKGVTRVCEPSGETLDSKKRETLERAFHCRVVNRYGNAEFGIAAYQNISDNRGWMKVLDSVVWPEAADAGFGKQELVFTGLLNFAMPLIRYKTGDLGTVVEEPDGLYLKDVIGRVHDVVRIGENTYPTHYIQDLLDRVGGIAEFQVVQENRNRITLRIVLESEDLAEPTAQKIRSWWGDVVQVEFVGYDGLERQGRLGKFRYVVRSGE